MSNSTQKSSDQNSRIRQRLQEPQPPYPYEEQQIRFENVGAGISLAGTLTIPHDTPKATVVLIAGYGKNNRDNAMMGHRPFAVLADYLARQGIAVLRYDKRGVGESTGAYETATSEDFAQDVRAAVDFLVAKQGAERTPLVLIGFSEGGLLASMVAANCPAVNSLILMAPALVTDIAVLVEQMGNQLQADGASPSFVEGDRALRTAIYSIVSEESDVQKAQHKLRSIVKDYCNSLSESHRTEGKKLMFACTPEKAEGLIAVFNGPWYRFFLRYDARPLLSAIEIPTLVVTGDKDWIVSSKKLSDFVSHHFDKRGFKNYTLVDIPNVNHSFQTCVTGALSEYATNTETISPVALDLISQWIPKVC